MVAEVHRLTGAGPSIGPEKDVVSLLEELLEEAKVGKIIGFGVFTVDGFGSIATNYASGCADQHLMLAGASMLHYRINKSVAESNED